MVHRRQPVAVARRDDEQGAVIILFALLTLTLMVMVALVIDLGNARQTRRQAQNAADAAALAAAVVLDRPGPPDFTAAVSDAKRYVDSNYGAVAWAGCTDPDALGHRPDSINNNECISFNSARNPNLVRVRVPTRSVTTFFGSVAGVNDVKVNASAIAQIPAAIPAPCALCVLSLSAHEALDLRGDGSLTVTGNGVVVNSNDSQAVVTGGASYLRDDDPRGVGVVGDYAGTDIQPVGAAHKIFPPVPDPLSGIPAPPLGGAAQPVTVDPGRNLNLQPGTYKDIDVKDTGTLVLGSGLYVITGEVTVETGGSIDGTTGGATFYFTCGGIISRPCGSRGEPGGTFNRRTEPAGTVVLNAPGSGTYKGMALFYDRNNTAGLIVTATFDITGTIYLASGQFKFQGGDPRSLRSMVVADTVVTTGAGALALEYNASENADVRRIPTLFR